MCVLSVVCVLSTECTELCVLCASTECCAELCVCTLSTVCLGVVLLTGGVVYELTCVHHGVLHHETSP